MSKKKPEVGEVWSLVAEADKGGQLAPAVIEEAGKAVVLFDREGVFRPGHSIYITASEGARRLAKSPKKFFKKLARGDFD